nr:retrovirus-related Pol polyprotein from transposon TNT 1-94 [Tanacetum cinerariifolium]
NGVVERWNRTLVEAARTMLSAAKVSLFFWAEAIATACFTQNRSLVIPRHEKTPYHIINERKPSVKFFHIFGSVCYIVRDGENLDKMKEKVHNSSDPAPTCQTMASAHNSSDPVSTCQTMASVQISSDPAPECQTMALEHGSLSPRHKCQDDVSYGDKTDDEFINIFKTPVQDQGETSSHHVDSSNIHTFYQRYPSEERWT